ncbi:MAG: SDR family oxidoreductase [Bacteroidia bacterium]|nr:SDR family oxidoreductase [Bacteroidia bacterium]MDW8158799.1 SDR family oxidoreductase [Bacteroidia bacterium]
MIDLQGKRALVGGSTQGIGKAIAVLFAKLGAHVTLLARDEQKLRATLAELDTSKEQQHAFLCADFKQPTTLKSTIDSYIARGVSFDILVNNTGGPAPGAITEASIVAFEEAFAMHVLCNHILTQALLPNMKEKKYGRIINIISTSVKQPIPGLGVSNTIRAAVASWAKTLASEVAPYGITVNNVLPGATQTARLESLILNKAQKTQRTREDIIHEMLQEIPAKRFASPEEIANAVAFLASPAAAYITGISLAVDGGRTTCL